MGHIGTHYPSSIGLFCPQLVNWFVDPQPVLPTSNPSCAYSACTGSGAPACICRVPTQPVAGPSAPVGARLGSVVNLPLSSLGSHCRPLCVCVAEVGWPRHCGEAAPRRLQRQRTLQTIYLSLTANIVMLRLRPRHRPSWLFLGLQVNRHSLARPQSRNHPNG